MKVDGNEFLRNVSLEQDKEKLKKEQEKIDRKKTNAIKSDEFFSSNDEPVNLNLSFDNNEQSPNQENLDDFNHLNDIKLNPDSNEDNKKKYIVLGLALVLLFIITIVVIRVLSNNEQEDKLSQNIPEDKKVEYVEQATKEDVLEKIETQEEYERVIEQKESYENKQVVDAPVPVKKDIILPEPVKEEPPIKIEKETKISPKRDLFGLENSNIPNEQKEPKVVKKAPPIKQEIKKEVKKIEQKNKIQRKIIVDAPKETNFVKKATKVSGYYIQIGSFSKQPSSNYLKNIKNKGYRYAVHPVDIKGKVYNKVLIGAYPTRNVAKSKLSKVRKDFKVPGAYILKF